MNALVPIASGGEVYRQSTDAAGLCGAIVKQTARDIQGRKYVTVEGWQAIAIAHGCAAGARDVEKVEGGVRAIGEVRRMSDGQIIAVAEGFVGEDEPTWFGGTQRSWEWGKRRGEKVWFDKELPKRADYAIRAMAQTRAISRACRSAFAHVVVMIDADLATTPAEEVPDGGFIDVTPEPKAETNSGGMPDDELKRLTQKMEAGRLTAERVCEKYGVKDLRALNFDQFNEVIGVCDERIAKQAKAETNKAAQSNDDGFGSISEADLAA